MADEIKLDEVKVKHVDYGYHSLEDYAHDMMSAYLCPSSMGLEHPHHCSRACMARRIEPTSAGRYLGVCKIHDLKVGPW